MKIIPVLISVFIVACSNHDSNSKPIYGEDTGLPANCRAYIQIAVNEWRRGTHDADVTMNAIERNCGEHGELWNYEIN